MSKKIFVLLSIVACAAFAQTVSAQTPSSESSSESSSSSTYGSRTTVVYVTEMIPGMEDQCSAVGGGSASQRTYRCEIGSGFSSIMSILGGLIKYATFLTTLVGVLMIVVSGVQYSMSGMGKDMRADAKKRIQQVLLGLVFLLMLASILNTLAPWIYK